MIIANGKFHDFTQKNNEQLKLRKPLDYLYTECHGFKTKEVTDKELQLLGADILAKKNDKRIIIDEKIQITEYNFQSEMLLEMESRWHSSDKIYQQGWANREDLITDWLVEYNPSSKRFFIYDARKLKKIITILELNNLENVEKNYPGTYVKKSNSKHMYTLCVICPREYLNKALLQTGILVTDF